MVFFFYLIFLLTVISNCDQINNQYQCIRVLTMTPCNQNLDVGINYSCPGADVFKQYSSPTIQKFAISGWFFLKGSLNQNYNLITVLENNQPLFQVKYSIYSSLFTSTLISQTPQSLNQNDSVHLAYKWYFVIFKMEVIVGTQLNLQLNIYCDSSQFYLTQSTTMRSSVPFQASQMTFDYGNGQTNTQYSCVAIYMIFIYWDSDLIDNQSNLINNLQQLDIQLKWNYDTFYAQYNQGNLIQANNPNGKLDTRINRNEQFVLKSQEQIVTDFVNAQTNQGFILTFHFKLISQSGSSNQIQIVQILSLPNSQLIFQNNQLQFFGQQISGIQLNMWYQITIIFNSQAQYIYLIVNDDQANLITSNINTVIQFSQILFGDTYNTKFNLYLNYIRIYEGTFLSNSPSCFMLQGRNQNNCIICRSGYLIDYQNEMTCVSPSSNNFSTLINNVKDWIPKQFPCPKNMILNNQNVCVCMFQYYREGDDCLLCQNYCQGCINAYTCIKMDPNRQNNGKCQDNMFDDGYNCQDPKYNIQSRLNYIKTLSPSDIENSECASDGTQPSYLIDNSILQLQKGKGFLFSFNMIIQTLANQATIAYLQDSNSDLFVITQEKITNNGIDLPTINLYVKTTKIVSLIIELGGFTQISFWTDFNSCSFFIYFNLIMQYHNTYVGSYFSSYVVQNPIFCAGKCGSNLQNIYACASYSQIIYIYDIKQIIDPTQVNYLKLHFTQQISLFELDFFNLPTSNSIKDQSNVYTLVSNSNIISNRFKGIQFTQNINAYISGVNFYQNYPSFSCYIFIEELNFQQRIFQMDLGSSQIQYHIVPYGTKAFIRICQFNVCIDTKYSMLNINEQNFLYIIYRMIGAMNTAFQEFEIFCNYKREVLYFSVNQQTYLAQSTIYLFQQVYLSNSQKQSVYLNKIRIEVGEGFYYQDQNQSEKCFLFRNIDKMECMIPKKGYVFYQNNLIITENECNNLTLKQNSFHIVNPSTQECINTQLSPYCQQIDDLKNTLSCVKCQYKGQDPSQNCQCPFGTYLNLQNSKCQQCSPQCETCVSQSNNCLTCKYNDQSPPTCSCLLQNQFLDENYVCKTCSYKCKTCFENSDKCTACSDNRSNPPNCDCESQQIEINGQCQQLKCENKCLTCDQSTSNCIQCSIGRYNPPICNCKPNHVQNLDGTCSQCISGYFYDQTENNCQQCSAICLSCQNKPNNCTSCISGLILQSNQCVCPNGTSVILLQNEILCLNNMDVNLSLILNSNFYYLVFKFDYDIQQLNNYYQNNITKLISVSFSEIPQSFYEISDPKVQGNILKLKLNIYKSFSTLHGWVQFLDNTQFLSISKKFILNSQYKLSFLRFEIGPFLFDKNTMDGGVADQIVNKLQDSSKNIAFNFIKQFQLILYILNTAQPSALFLLVNANLPPNLYKFYQVIGLLIYPDVVNYQSTNYKQNFQLFYADLNQEEVFLSSEKIYKKLGFCNSFMVNSQGIIIKYILIILILILFYILQSQKHGAQNMQNNKLFVIKSFFIKKLNSENDTNLLLLIQSILVQFTFNDDQIWAIRYGYYLALIFAIMQIMSFYLNAKQINTKKEYDEQDYSYQYTERLLDTKNKFNRNYFIIQLLKKYLVLIVLFFFKRYPYLACIINGIIFFLSCLSTIIMKPYQNLISRLLKLFGDLLISVCWFLHIPIIVLENIFTQQAEIDQKQINQYLALGQVIIIIIIIFNGLFLFQKIIEVIQVLYKLISPDKQSKQNVIQLTQIQSNYFKNQLDTIQNKSKSYQKKQSQNKQLLINKNIFH
ncbi:bowman-birk serine protease inhibitor family protein (macronuclear) [Tetrahymena thermophila SB210]|uniref:Bowman-birk serine protease inhibitor family protein n=1 Tax=Tetrahymena thermophila (strain SB210) TaxID=312017 RepID=W7X0C0_TETTS|nr:bowman-birk serine protease inhibitor family protein [Tetrahymena thermophila SB210]EWS71302.1 bowman-birk serine protease inhibitor family protein [Tetrahymena thermophila SB210]|eukprot:XP_012656166.1 bowman-birk serine protease inhibitor family protein [Tetrahymena thermophila SB210]